MARPSKYTPARKRIILEALRAGMTRYAAAGMAQIVVDTLQDWVARYPSFSNAVHEAEEAAAARMESVVIKSAAGGNEDTAQWWLRRRRRQDWGDTVDATIAHSGSIDTSGFDEDAILAAAEAIRASRERSAPAEE